MSPLSSTLCATYLCMSMAVIFIIVGAMWDSFLNTAIGIAIYDNGVQQYTADATVGLVLTHGKNSEAMLCAVSGQDPKLTTSIASVDSFRGIFQVDNGRLALFNKRGAVCLTFADLAKLQDFTKAFLSVHHEVSGSSEKDGEKGGFAGGLADSEVDLDLADSEVDLDLADSEVDLDLTESEVYLTASDIVTASVVDGGESGWDFCV